MGSRQVIFVSLVKVILGEKFVTKGLKKRFIGTGFSRFSFFLKNIYNHCWTTEL